MKIGDINLITNFELEHVTMVTDLRCFEKLRTGTQATMEKSLKQMFNRKFRNSSGNFMKNVG